MTNSRGSGIERSGTGTSDINGVMIKKNKKIRSSYGAGDRRGGTLTIVLDAAVELRNKSGYGYSNFDIILNQHYSLHRPICITLLGVSC